MMPTPASTRIAAMSTAIQSVGDDPPRMSRVLRALSNTDLIALVLHLLARRANWLTPAELAAITRVLAAAATAAQRAGRFGAPPCP
jgi:hypothetical protein